MSPGTSVPFTRLSPQCEIAGVVGEPSDPRPRPVAHQFAIIVRQTKIMKDRFKASIKRWGREMNRIPIVVTLLSTAIAIGCGGGTAQSTQPIQPTTPNLTGQWEVIATSSEGQAGNLIEASLQSNGASNQYADAGEEPYLILGLTLTRDATGTCSLGNISLSISGDNVQYTIGGTNAAGTGTYNTNTITGTYSQPSPCADRGSFAATEISPLTGTYAGSLIFIDGNVDSVTATLTSSTTNFNSGFSASLQVTGDDNGSTTLGGFQAGAIFSAGGTFQGTPIAYSGFLVTPQNSVFFPTALVGNLVVFEGVGVPFCGSDCASEPSFIGILAKQ
jgi:hypothetical protein